MRSQHKPPKKPNQRNSSKRVSAKTLAFELGLDVHTVRVVLRARYRRGKDRYKPWIWNSSKDAAEVRRYLTKMFGTEKPQRRTP